MKNFFEETYNVKLNVIENFKKGFNQIFIIDLLKILPLEEYYEILDHDISANRVNFYNIFSTNEWRAKRTEREKQKKVFYLLRYLEINKLFHIPKNILKITSLINKNKN